MSKFFHGTYRVGLCWSSLCLSLFFHFLPWVFIFSNLKLFAVFVSSLFHLFLFLSEMMNSPHPQSSATIAWLNLLTVKDLRGYLWLFLFLGFCRKQAEWIAKCEDMTKKVLVLKNCQLFCCVCVFILDSIWEHLMKSRTEVLLWYWACCCWLVQWEFHDFLVHFGGDYSGHAWAEHVSSFQRKVENFSILLSKIF